MSARIVSAKEARGIIANGEAQIAAGWGGIGVLADVANTVIVQAEQIAAALAVHKSYLSSVGYNHCACDGSRYPCPTARALGVTA